MIERSEHDGIVTLRLAHGKASAFDTELATALSEALRDAENARAVVLAGSGTIFSAGVDLKRIVEGGANYAREFLRALDEVLERLFFCPRPVVAAVNGHAIAGGCILAAASDRRLMAVGSGRIGVPELLVGVPFPTLPLAIMRFALSPPALQYLVVTGATPGPEEAKALGLVDELVPAERLEARAREVAGELARIPAESFRIVKAELRQPTRDFLDAQRVRIDREVEAVWTSESTRAFIRGYIERTFGAKRG